MKRVLVLALVLAGCDGTAPLVQSPSAALNQDRVQGRCIANEPPAGYRGPVSPYSGSCAPEASAPVTAPGGSHDYSTGMPARTVR